MARTRIFQMFDVWVFMFPPQQMDWEFSWAALNNLVGPTSRMLDLEGHSQLINRMYQLINRLMNDLILTVSELTNAASLFLFLTVSELTNA